MRNIIKLLTSLTLLILFFLETAHFYPDSVPLAFLTSTFLVAINTLLSGRVMGILSYVWCTFLLLTFIGVPEPSYTELLTRIVMFTIASGVLSIVIDKIQRTETEAIRQKEQLKVISDSLTEVLITINEKSIITYTNPSIEPIFGYKPEEIIGKDLTMLMPPELRAFHLAGLERYIKTNKKRLDWKSVETTGLRRNGEKFPIEISFGEFSSDKGRAFSAVIRDISIRKNFQLKLNELAAIVESSEDAIISKDLNGIIKTWNKGAEKIFGWKAEEIIGKSILTIFPDDYIEDEEMILASMRQGKPIAHYETVRKTKDGTLVDVSLSISPVKSANGEIIAVSKIARDITYRKRQENEAKISAERYKTFIDNSDEAIWMIEYRPPIDTTLPKEEQIEQLLSNAYVMEANSRMAELYEINNIGEIIGQNIVDLGLQNTEKHKEEGHKLLNLFIANNYSVVNWESSNIDPKTGRTRYGSTNFKGIVQNGNLIRAWVVQRETTQKRLQERELEQSKERYKAFIENSEDAIWRTEFTEPISTSLPVEEQVNRFFKQGYIAEANQATATILKASNLESLLNKPLESVGSRTMGDDRFMAQFIASGYVLNDYESSRIEDGKVIYTSSSVMGILDGDKWVRAWVIRRDITKQKEYQIEREKLLTESEKIRRDLEIASTEKDRFLANLSHELRTPLVAILGYSSMLIETSPDSETAKKMISTINKNAKLQVQLIEDLLDLSRIISGKIELHKEIFDVSQVIKDSVETLRTQASEKELKIVENTGSTLFYGDKKRISQVILNLLSNAIKFTEKGQVKICTKVDEDFLTLKVSDTGIGIRPEDFQKLFQPFKQLDSSPTRTKQGLGLGLSIVKNIVDLHGGKVDVASKIGEGSEFKVYFPVIQPIISESKDENPTTVNSDFSGVKILLVEDDLDGGGFIKYLYEQKGAEVDWVTSAKKAREQIANKKYSIYIFDLSMPEEDGISLIKSVRKSGDKTKSVALTAFVDSYYESIAIESGFDMFLKKPSSLAELLSIISLVK